MKRTILIVSALTATHPVYSGDCESIIGLSKLTTATTSDKSAIEQHAANFCREYKQYVAAKRNSANASENAADNRRSSSSQSGSTSSFSGGASYGVLSASMSQSKSGFNSAANASSDYAYNATSSADAAASVDDIASKYCNATSDYSARDDAYRQYVESIAPGAFDAYKSCIEFSAKDLTFHVEPGSILPTEFVMTASFKSSNSGVASADVEYSASNGVACTWNGEPSTKKVIPTGGSAILKCSRADQEKPAFVTLVGTTVSSRSMVMPWTAYPKDGGLVDLQGQIKELRDQIERSIKSKAWTLIYANDETGNTTYGNISALINAIKQGKNVKVSTSDEGIDYLSACDEVYVNTDNSVTCSTLQNISIRSTLPGANFGFQDNAYHYFRMINTKGQRSAIRWSVGEHADRGRSDETIGIKWFIN